MWQLQVKQFLVKRETEFSSFLKLSDLLHITTDQAIVNEGRYSNGSLVSSEEGYYSTDSGTDENKTNNHTTTTTTKSTFTYLDSDGFPLLYHNQNHSNMDMKTSTPSQRTNAIGRRRHTTIVAPSSKRPTPSAVEKRVKRKKMEELKEVRFSFTLFDTDRIIMDYLWLHLLKQYFVFVPKVWEKWLH